jgi:hypothetical protein
MSQVKVVAHKSYESMWACESKLNLNAPITFWLGLCGYDLKYVVLRNLS